MKLAIRDLALLAFLASANLLGVIIGFIYYSGQLNATSPLLWIFVPDCPLYVGLFALLIALSFFGIRNAMFSFLVSVGLMKYAAWTLFVLAFYNSYFFSMASLVWLQSAFLFVLHIGMTGEGFILPLKKIAKWQVAVVLGWFLLNDLVDYFGPQVHPYLPPGASVLPAMVFAIVSTFALTLLAAKLVKENKRVPIAGLSS